jgi:hypothetical protein
MMMSVMVMPVVVMVPMMTIVGFLHEAYFPAVNAAFGHRH